MPKYRVLQKCYFNDAIREEGDEIEIGLEVFDPSRPSSVLELIEPVVEPVVEPAPKKTAKSQEAA